MTGNAVANCTRGGGGTLGVSVYIAVTGAVGHGDRCGGAALPLSLLSLVELSVFALPTLRRLPILSKRAAFTPVLSLGLPRGLRGFGASGSLLIHYSDVEEGYIAMVTVQIRIEIVQYPLFAKV